MTIDERPLGIECPRCGCRHWLVVYTIRMRDAIKRRRECRHCGKRSTTYERSSAIPAERSEESSDNRPT